MAFQAHNLPRGPEHFDGPVCPTVKSKHTDGQTKLATSSRPLGLIKKTYDVVCTEMRKTGPVETDVLANRIEAITTLWHPLLRLNCR
jgi:hypothetical protein